MLLLLADVADGRFIPTCVGNTLNFVFLFQSSTRFIPTCVGNTPNFLPISSNVRGSSPRAWGTPLPFMFTPRQRPVHPHVRGEHAHCYRASEASCRFIPTCVGNTR